MYPATLPPAKEPAIVVDFLLIRERHLPGRFGRPPWLATGRKATSSIARSNEAAKASLLEPHRTVLERHFSQSHTLECHAWICFPAWWNVVDRVFVERIE